MRKRLLLAAAFEWRTLIILGAGIAAAAALSNPFPAVIGLGLYVWAVERLASSPRFAEAGEKARLTRAMEERFKALQEAARTATNAVAAATPFGQGRPVFGRANDVMNAARQIYHEWLARPDQQLAKSQIVDEGLHLALIYMKMMRAYHAVYFAQKPTDLAVVRNRLAANRQRLERSVDLEARRSLNQAIEMDERVLRQADEAAVERERYQAKLAAIEASLDLLQRQIFDPGVDEGADRLHAMLLEAEAMDQALAEVQQRSPARVRA